MLYKYIKTILLLTVLLQASPKTFDSLGNELEVFQKDCEIFQEISSLPAKIKKQCNLFNSKLHSAFKIGYKLDPYIDSDNINEKKLNKYLSLLRKLEESKENILESIYMETTKARKHKNIKYYSQLIKNNNIKLYSIDYDFMKKNIALFANNERYLSHIKYIKDISEQYTEKPQQEDTKTYTQRNNQVTQSTYNTSSIIIQDCKNKWGNNYEMVQFCIKEQSKAKKVVSLKKCQSLWGSAKRQCLNYQRDIGKPLMSKCKSKWGNNYEMVQFCVDEQTKSYKKISQITDNSGQDKCKNMWGSKQRVCLDKQTKRREKLTPSINRCKNKWGNNYEMVQYCMENN